MRQLAKTAEITKLLQDSISPEVDLETLAVYETIALNTNPVSKKGSLFDGSRPSKVMLEDMATFINKERKIPLQLMHDTSKIPVGTVFAAQTFPTEADSYGVSGTELRQMFFVNNTTQDGKDLIAKLDAGVVNEVSVNFNPTHIRCSECGFDYNGPEADFWDNILEGTCNEGHVIGQDGVHTKLEGLSKYWETSLVNNGAADHARIASPADAKMLKESMQLAASASSKHQCKNLTISLSVGSTTMPPVEPVTEPTPAADPTPAPAPEPAADPTPAPAPEAPTADLGAPAVTFSVTMDDVLSLKATAKQTSEELASLKATLAATTEELTVAKADAAKLVSVEADLTKAVEFMKTSYQNLMVACGASNFTVPNDVAALTAGILSAQAQLSKLPVGGVSVPAGAGTPAKSQTASVDAFRTKS